MLLDGYYGMHNTGDDAFCVVGSWLAATSWGVDDLTLMAESLPVLPYEARAALAGSGRFRGHRRARAAYATLRARRVVHLGGSTMRRLNRHRRDQLAMLRTGAIRVEARAVSIGPFRSAADSRGIRDFLSRCDYISVRDDASVNRANEIGLDVVAGFDAAVLLGRIPWAAGDVDVSRGMEPVLAVSVCPVESSTGEGDPALEERRTLLLAEALRQVASQGVRIRFIVMNGHPRRGDERVTRRVAESIAAAEPNASVDVVAYDGDVRSVVSALRSADALLGMRLHSGILAYSLGLPFMLVDQHPKCGDFAASVALSKERLIPTGIDDARQVTATILDCLAKPTTVAGLPLGAAQARALEGLSVANRAT
jgi:polysaccharide pyruvyl transferase WcaK-like protein